VLETLERYYPKQPSGWTFELDHWAQGLLDH
jgi:hypothetical protein